MTPEELKQDLIDEITVGVWDGLTGNGSLKIDIDTDVDICKSDEPNHVHDPEIENAWDWVEYFVTSTVNELMRQGALPRDAKTTVEFR